MFSPTIRPAGVSKSPSGRDVYFEFAWAYDQALGRRFFASVSTLLDRILEKYPAEDRSHLDIACGTGLVVAHLREKGYRSIGLDGSLAMLLVARKRATGLIAADYRAIPIRASFSRITCLYDSFNHLLEHHDLVTAFRCASALMHDDSLFLFDVNHPDVYPRIWGLREPYISAGTGYRLVMHTRYSEDKRLGVADLTGWADVGGRRVKISESHSQRPWSGAEVLDALAQASLEVVEQIDFDPFEESGEGGPGVKWFFIVRRKVSPG